VLFRATGVNRTRTELLLVLTVDILRTDEDMRNMSLAQRDKYGLPNSILQSPLMEKLRISPEEAGMGPQPAKQGAPQATPSPGQPPANGQDTYGPKPKSYGPTVPGTTTTSTSGKGRVYGPSVATSESASSNATLMRPSP
jgi:hypothetical protein